MSLHTYIVSSTSPVTVLMISLTSQKWLNSWNRRNTVIHTNNSSIRLPPLTRVGFPVGTLIDMEMCDCFGNTYSLSSPYDSVNRNEFGVSFLPQVCTDWFENGGWMQDEQNPCVMKLVPWSRGFLILWTRHSNTGHWLSSSDICPTGPFGPFPQGIMDYCMMWTRKSNRSIGYIDRTKHRLILCPIQDSFVLFSMHSLTKGK